MFREINVPSIVLGAECLIGGWGSDVTVKFWMEFEEMMDGL
jgi:hypothetical protein